MPNSYMWYKHTTGNKDKLSIASVFFQLIRSKMILPKQVYIEYDIFTALLLLIWTYFNIIIINIKNIAAHFSSDLNRGSQKIQTDGSA